MTESDRPMFTTVQPPSPEPLRARLSDVFIMRAGLQILADHPRLSALAERAERSPELWSFEPSWPKPSARAIASRSTTLCGASRRMRRDAIGMSDDPSNNGRETDGRFAAGNKASRGKPKGARHRATVMAARLLDNDAADIIKKLVAAAKNGEPWAIKFVAERLLPPAKLISTFIGPIDYAEPKTPEEARTMILELGGRMARGEISIEEHIALLDNLKAYLGDKAAEQQKILDELADSLRHSENS